MRDNIHYVMVGFFCCDAETMVRMTISRINRMITLMVALAAINVLSMPTAQEITKAQPMVQELMADAMADVNAKKKSSAEAAEVSIRLAANAESEAAKYLLLRGAFLLYARAGEFVKAGDAIDLLRKEVKEIPVETLYEILAPALVGVKEEKAPSIYALYSEAKRIVDAKREIKEIEPVLKKSPADKRLRRRLAECYVLAGNWPSALKHFSRLGQEFADIATFEKSGLTTGTVNSLTAGDFWWDYTTSNDAVLFKNHAAEWYRKALKEKLPTGLKQELVIKRLASLEARQTDGKPAVPSAATAKKTLKPGEVKTLTLPGGVVMRFRWCPAGTFMMGSPQTEAERGKDETRHQVTLAKGFWLGETEVTQAQWEDVIENNPSRFKSGSGGERPVEKVSWEDCQRFVQRVNERLKCGMRLPTEEEWEYACRAGTDTPFAGTGDPDEMGWNGGNSGKETHAVGLKPPNDWGFCDMHGNVWEWCADLKDTSNATDPNAVRVKRGGSSFSPAGRGRSASRGGDVPTYASWDTGFRVALSEEKE